MSDAPASTGLPAVWFPLDAGISLRRPSDQLGPGALADATNLDAQHPKGTLGPRLGSRSLTGASATPASGHPVAPMGHGGWDGSAIVLRLIPDETRQQLWALVRTEADKAQVYRADLSDDSPGFAAVGSPIDVDDDHVPSIAAYAGKLFIATGVAALSRNVVVSDNTVSVQTLTPLRPPTPTVNISLSGSRSAVTGYIYATVARDSRTGAVSKAAQSLTSGPFSSKRLQVNVFGTANETVFDKIEIYRSTDGGDTLRFLDEIPNPGGSGSSTYTDTVEDDRLSFRTPPEHVGRTPTSRYVLAAMDRLLWGYRSETVVEGSLLYYSDAFHPFSVDPTVSFLTVRPEDGDVLTGMGRLYNRSFAFKSRQIYELVSGGSFAPFIIQPVVNEGAIGSVAHNTIVEIEGRLFFLSYGGLGMFTGEAAAIVPGPLSESAVEQQVYSQHIGTNQRQYVTFEFTHDDVVSETYQFTLKFFSTLPDDPAGGPATATLESDDSSERVYADGRRIDHAAGLTLAPGQRVTVQFDWTNRLQPGRRYYTYLIANDGHQDHDPVDLGPRVASEFRRSGLGVNWGRIARSHALDYWPKRELWLFVPSAGSDWPDVKYVLEYDTLEREGGPVWRRELGSFTASALCTGLNVDEARRNLIAPLYGDRNGCVWIDRWPTGIDREITRATPLTDAQHVVRGRLNETGGDWTIDTMTSLWTANELRGEICVVRDEHGEVYTGIVRGNSASQISISHWLEGRVPPLDSDVDAALGGMDARAEFHPQMLDEAAGVVETRELLVEGLGESAAVEVEVRIANQPELVSAAALGRMPQRRRRSVRVGDGPIRRYPMRGRGRYAGLRVGSWRHGQSWHLSKLGLGVHAAGSTH